VIRVRYVAAIRKAWRIARAARASSGRKATWPLVVVNSWMPPVSVSQTWPGTARSRRSVPLVRKRFASV
jgi:hypothetical protein